MSLSSGAAVSVEGLTRRFRRGVETVVALDDVSLELYPGELTVAAGPSGSGKTTLLSILAGFERADAGRVLLPGGAAPDQLSWRDLAFVPQSLALLDELTVAENIDLPARLDPAAAPPAAEWSTEQILDLLEISHLAGRYPSLTSGGEQQRTALGRAIRLRPGLLLADEPTGHQDRGRVDLVLGILRQHAYGGHAVLISSHDEAVIAAADRVVTMADGKIVEDSRAALAR
jgi:ABC-type lipoprotein export system ATPase subunit